ncbi:hypothetical protein [Anthocerotibacter panamensis]|uniref:hypothetical protein n=1 Tax=Anthocerotibacter panamensis TaxID=2857077 RepID=UPI001C403227|nr:hypothetical protein [Anthocerotibacter panamensis]
MNFLQTSVLLAAGLLVTAQPLLARDLQNLGQITQLTPSRYFLLKADGQAFKDAKGVASGVISEGRYTSRFTIVFAPRTGTTTRPTLALNFQPVDRTHHLSSDRQVASLEVDGVALPFVRAFDSFAYRNAEGSEENLHLVLEPLALKRILAAQKEVAVKVRLESTPLGIGGECATTIEGSAKQRSCGNPYTGVVFAGLQLKTLQDLLKPYIAAG